MKGIVFFVLLLTLSSCSDLRDPIIEKLPFGGNLYLMRDEKSKLLHVNVILENVGSNLDPEGKYGLADLTTTLLSSGNTRFDKDTFQSYLDQAGIKYTTDINRNYIKLNFVCLKSSTNILLDVIRLLLKDAEFPQTELEQELRRRIGIIGTNLAYDDFLAEYYAKKYFFTGAYRYPVDGSIKSLSSIKRDDLLSFYRNYFVKENISISILGDFDGGFLSSVYNMYNNLNSGIKAKDYDLFSYKHGKHVLIVNKKGVRENNVYMLLPLKDMNFSSKKLIYLDLFANIFSMGMDSILFEQLRKQQGIAYHISGSWANESKHHLYYYTEFNPRIGLVGRGIKTILNSLKIFTESTVAASVLQRKISYLENIFIYKQSTKKNILNRFVMHKILGFDPNYDKMYLKRLSELDGESFNDFIKNLFKKDIYIAVVGDKRLLMREEEFYKLGSEFKIDEINYDEILKD